MGCLFDTEKRRRQTAKLPSSAVLPVMKKAAGSARRARYPVLRTSLVPPAPRRLDQLQERHRRGISPARPKFEQPGVTTVAVAVAGSHFFKELAHRFGIVEKGRRLAPSVKIAPFSQGDHLIHQRFCRSSLAFGRLNSAVQQDGGDE